MITIHQMLMEIVSRGKQISTNVFVMQKPALIEFIEQMIPIFYMEKKHQDCVLITEQRASNLIILLEQKIRNAKGQRIFLWDKHKQCIHEARVLIMQTTNDDKFTRFLVEVLEPSITRFEKTRVESEYKKQVPLNFDLVG